MKKRLFLYTTLTLLVGLLSYFAASVYVTYNNNINLAKDTVIEATQVCADVYAIEQDASAFAKAGSSAHINARITIIAPDGAVLADNRPLDLNSLENHLDRPEIQAALNGTPATYIRYSETLGADLIYYALKVDNADSYAFVRVGIPVAKIDTYLFQSLPLLAILLFVIALLCFSFTGRTIRRIIKPFASIEQKLRSLASGEYTREPASESYEEIDKIVQGIDEVARTLQDSFNALSDEKNKHDYILDNIGDGLFVVDENKDIVLINPAALGIFNAGVAVADKNLNYLSYDETLASAIDDCIHYGKDTLFEISLDGHIYFVAVKQLPETLLTMVVLSDVTENRESAKRREEFFANASHELKTPLTAIKGFNELTALNNKDEGLRKYIDGISRETDRMLSLIVDMLKLSELENTQEITPVPVSLSPAVIEISEVLSVAIDEKDIRFNTVGDAEVTAEPRHIYDLVKNLIENAVRYSKQGGSVSVRIEGAEGEVHLVVSDDGIGISPEEQARIFERFYRVEKSRSQRNGGTGLGLSIVKHICVLYDWKLSLESKLGLGTTITIIFPKN